MTILADPIWQELRLVNAACGLLAFSLWCFNLAGQWRLFSRDARRVSLCVAGLLGFVSYGSLEAYRAGSQVLWSTVGIAAVLVLLCASLAADWARSHRLR